MLRNSPSLSNVGGLVQDTDFLKEAPSQDRALSIEKRLFDAASKSRCRSLYPVILLAINTGMRANEIRLLTWEQVDFLAKSLVVGKPKTAAGTGPHPAKSPRDWYVRLLARSIPKCTTKTSCFPSRKIRICWKPPQTVQLWHRPVDANAALEGWMGKRPQGGEGLSPLS